ncbi:MAG: histidine kinase [Burkholderiales bacterium]|jgi:two-component system sensor histidine kinase AlgZ|nr:histidine kinase [Burkholderiales bacterium]
MVVDNGDVMQGRGNACYGFLVGVAGIDTMNTKYDEYAPLMPDWRNLGVVLRTVLGVNLGMVLAVLARHGDVREWPLAMTELVGYVEPILILVLTVLWLCGPRLTRLPYAHGVAVMMAITAASAMLIAVLLRSTWWLDFAPVLFWSLLAQVGMLYYFHMRNRMLSPVVTEAKLQALQARIRPHFLFNSINAVMSIVRHDPQQAEAALQDMADLFRVLMRDNRDLTPLSDEVELCRQYLGLEKLRLGSRFEVDWNVKSMPADAMVPPLVLQPLLENAIYHGIETASAGGTISVNIFLSRDVVHAILRNPYQPGNKRHHRGNKIAVANVRARLALHFDAEAGMSAKVINDEAYEVHIRMPYRKPPPPASADQAERQTAAGNRKEQEMAPRADKVLSQGSRE